jgi:hypothetical protein
MGDDTFGQSQQDRKPAAGPSGEGSMIDKD